MATIGRSRIDIDMHSRIIKVAAPCTEITVQNIIDALEMDKIKNLTTEVAEESIRLIRDE